MPKGFVKPSKDAIKASDYKFSHIPYFWKNTGAFKKKLVVDDPWTSFYFSNYHTLTTRSSDLADSLKTYPFIYFSEGVYSLAQSAIQPINTSNAALRNSFQFKNLNANYEFLKFTPQTIRLVVASPKDAILNIQQAYYSGWTCSIDSNPTDIFLNAGLLMSVKVPKGFHTIEFNYSNHTFKAALYTSYIVLILLLIVLVFLIFKNGKYKIIFTLMILFFTISFVHSSQVNYNDSEFESKSFLTINGNIHKFNLDNQKEMLNVFTFIDSVNSHEYSYSWKNYYHSPEFWYRLGVDDYLNRELYHLNGSYQWNKNTIQNSLSLMSLISENKHDTLILNSESPYTPAIDITLQTINRSDIVGKIRLKTEENATPVIACVVKEKNKSEQVSYFEIRKYVRFNTTHSIPFYFKLPERSNDIESIKLFVMNNSKQNIEIMDIEILNNRLSQQDKH
jgi:hypothetical protein